MQDRNRKSATKTAIPENTQQKWTNIVGATTVAADNTPEIKIKEDHHVSKKISELSQLQKMPNCSEIWERAKLKDKPFV